MDFLLEKQLDRAAFDRLMSIFPDIESKDDWCGNVSSCLLFFSCPCFPCRFPMKTRRDSQDRLGTRGWFEEGLRKGVCVFFFPRREVAFLDWSGFESMERFYAVFDAHIAQQQ